MLACAPSNVAVDNIVERLAPHKVNLVRVLDPLFFLVHLLCIFVWSFIVSQRYIEILVNC